ncbi:MAG: MBL fold metallo-hydrolase [Vicinamibacterales bacterium]
MPDQQLHGLLRVPIVFVNAYLVDISPNQPDAGWFLVDTGLRSAGASLIRQAARQRYGPRSAPRGIVLTHGHFDHAGSAAILAEHWGVPLFAHSLELPYLTGQSAYPPQDPTVGGALAMMSRAFPRGAMDVTNYLVPVSDDSLPFAAEWQVLHTPGHTAGHVSLWREKDRVLVAGDALATMNQESWTTTITMPRELRWPPAPMTTDWDAATASIQRLAALRPHTVVAGHGLPIVGEHVADLMDTFASNFTRPSHGRYVRQPALADRRGVVDIPPPAADPVGSALRVAAGSAAMGALVLAVSRLRRRA